MIGFKLLSVACWIGVVLAQQDYQQQQEYHRPAPLRIGTNAVETKPTPIPILKQINSDRGEYYRKRCFTAVRNNCKLRSAEKIRSKYNPKALNFAADSNAVQKQLQKEQQQQHQQQQQQVRIQNGGGGGGSVGNGPTGPALFGGKKLFKKF